MGRDVTLYPTKATREQLSEYLKSLGFKRCQHLWEWPKGTLNYSWFDDYEYRSIDGVSADVYPVRAEETPLTDNKWALHVRNLYSASWHDVNMLNGVLRGARKRFGGTIRGDYGINRYAPLWIDESTPISRGITRIFQSVDQTIRKVRHAIPEPSPAPPVSRDKKVEWLNRWVRGNDPSRVIYNGLVPFAVSMFEYFFREAFLILAAHDKAALKRRTESSASAKLDFATMQALRSGDTTIEEIIADGYSFQSIEQINKAYLNWIGMDIKKILSKRRRAGKSAGILLEKIVEIVDRRHGVVHRFEVDTELTKDAFIALLETVRKAIAELVSEIEKKYGVRIERY